MVSRRQAARVRIVRCGRISTTHAAQAKRWKERKDAKVKAHLTERAEYRFWDHWLTDGREPHVFVCDVAQRPRDATCSRGTGSRAAAVGAVGGPLRDIAPDGREIALTIDPASEPAMMNRCDIAVVSLQTRRASAI